MTPKPRRGVGRWAGLTIVLLAGCTAATERPVSSLTRLQSLYLPMRDGIRIAVDVWLPEGFRPGEAVPTIMRSTRYWRAQDVTSPPVTDDSNFRWADTFNRAGYAAVFVDARGTGASFGSRAYEMTEDEVRDYGEVVDWIVEQPWSNGRVGAYGVSYDGNTAEMLVVNQRASVPVVAPLFNDFDYLDYLLYPGGVFMQFFTDGWGAAVRNMDRNDVCGLQGVEDDACEALRGQVRGVKPVDADADGTLLARAVTDHAANVRVDDAARAFAYRDDPFGPDSITDLGSRANPAGHLEEIRAAGTAMFVRVGWLDAATVNGALSRFRSIENPQRVLIGPWSHGGGFHTDPFLPVDTPTDPPVPDQVAEMLAYFDPYLAASTPPPPEKLIIYSTLGTDRWDTTATWPPPGFDAVSWFFEPAGRLGRVAPTSGDGHDEYVVDFTATTGSRNRWRTNAGAGDVVYPDRAVEDRKLLTYTSPAMERDMVVTGHPIVTLYLTSTEPDGAVFVYLEDVAPDGRVTYITEGQLRVVHHQPSTLEPPHHRFGPYRTLTRADAKPLAAGELVEMRFDLWATSVLLARGHRIRVAIAGADDTNARRYPTDGSVPTLSVMRRAGAASHITLPMRPR